MLKLYNTFSKKTEKFTSINPQKVTMYSCGPTVYQYAHIGNYRAYMTSDLLCRVLKENKYNLEFVMNITDVGHLVSDEDTGEDKLEKSARAEKKTAWDIARFYTESFLKDYRSFNFTKPDILAKATDHIQEQIDLILKLEEKEYTYVISDGVYFDTSKLEDYGKLSTLDQIREGARVEINKDKRNPKDFALWKFSSPVDSGKRAMEWDSPWMTPDGREGKGFPGWHIECSAMSMRYLGNHIDIHTGGIDHVSVHHTNEIAQSEAATGEKFVNYWIHTAFMLVESQKMGKSLGNAYLLSDLASSGFHPMHLRYLYLQTHYRQEMNFTFDSLTAARNAYERLVTYVGDVVGVGKVHKEYATKFMESVNDDLNSAKALGVVWEMLKSNLSDTDKKATLLHMDAILGLGLKNAYSSQEEVEIPSHIHDLVAQREKSREEKDYRKADEIRDEIKKLGFILQDSSNGLEIKKI